MYSFGETKFYCNSVSVIRSLKWCSCPSFDVNILSNGVGRRKICAEGDSFTEPYLAGHNALNAHARAVSLYRTRYKREQGGMIGMTLNCDWAAVRK